MIERRSDGVPIWVKFGKAITMIVPIITIAYTIYFMNTWHVDKNPEKIVTPQEEVENTPSSDKDHTHNLKPVLDIGLKNDVVYIGVENPVIVLVDDEVVGMKSSQIVAISGCRVKKNFDGGFTVTASQMGNCVVEATVNGTSVEKEFAIRRMPSPVAKLGQFEEGEISAMDFKSQKGLLAVLEDFDYDAKCMIKEFFIKHQSKGRSKPRSKKNIAPRFNKSVQGEVAAAKSGDIYTFRQITARCPGDIVGRRLPDVVYKIK